MGEFAAVLGVVGTFLLIVLGILAILMPMFVYFIHQSAKDTLFQARKMNDNLERVIFLLGNLRPKEEAETESEDTAAKPKGPITILPDDPQNHKIGNIQCNKCGHKMPYPKRLSGSNVTCRSCSAPFQLP